MSVKEDDDDDATEEIWIRKLMNEVSESNDLASPIDLNVATMAIKKLKPLVWCCYQIPPKKLKLTNTGKTVVLSAKWHQETPFLVRGPFSSKYVFSQIHFHWGTNDMNGSEHSVDGGSQPMELHAVHFKNDYVNQEAAMRKPDGIAILVYFFKLQSLENPKINGIVRTLPVVEQANTSTRMIPWAITHLVRPFTDDYFLYRGSLNSGNNGHKVLWLISRQPIGISAEQLAEFRNLKDKNFVRVGRESPVVHGTGDRRVYHINPSGSTYASLLPIPRDDPTPNSMDGIDCGCEIVTGKALEKLEEPNSGL